MSTADVELFGPPDADGTYPRFTTVLRGYDPEQVRDFTLRLAARVEALERELDEAKAQRDAARKRYGMARDEAYNQLGQRMADVLRLADHQGEKIRREAEEESKQRIIQSRQLAAQIEREAEEHSARIRVEGEEALQRATHEKEALLGGLSTSRDVALADMAAARDHLEGIIERLGIAMDAARSARILNGNGNAHGHGTQNGKDADVDVAGAAGSEDAPHAGSAPAPSPQAEDFLTRTEGFEIMLPEFLLRESEDDDPQPDPGI